MVHTFGTRTPSSTFKMCLPAPHPADKIKDLVIDENIGAVVVGFDGLLTYSRIVSAFVCLCACVGVCGGGSVGVR